MRKRDNNCGEKLTEIEKFNIGDLTTIADKNLNDLLKENPDLLVFPQTLNQYRDGVENSYIFSLNEDILTTYNLMGFVGRNSSQLTISSRFAKDDKNDYFLHYMLQKVFSINLLDFDQTLDSENIWDFLLYLFPFYLKKAYSQGLYKAYKKEEYNDSNIKGTIDVKKHILRNIPFMGKIAYITREHSYNNNLTQLVRHTIEHIKTHPFGQGVLTNDSEVRDIVSKFIFVTDKTYNNNSRQKIITANLKPFYHPFFTEYAALQKICLKILKNDQLTFGNEKDKVYGLLFDGAWLWEEYLNTLLKDRFIHPENKTGRNTYHLFENDFKSFQKIFPDYLSKEKPYIVGDAKYIPLEQQRQYSEFSERATSIYYKTIAYMYRFSSEYGFLLFPHKETSYFETLKIKETNGFINKIGLAIPQFALNFNEFISTMNSNEFVMKKFLDTNKTKDI